MHSGPTSIEIMAETYRQTLLADVGRTRSESPCRPRLIRSLNSIALWHNLGGGALIRAGERLRGVSCGDASPAVKASTVTRNGQQGDKEGLVSDHMPSDDPDAPEEHPYDYYAYRFAAERQGLHDAILRAVHDDYCGQTSWTPTARYDRYYRWIGVAPEDSVLDVACGAGGPALRLARGAGCAVVGIDLNAQAIATATTLADEEGLGDRVRFVCHDATAPLPFPDQTFAAITCIDALVGLPDRPRIFAEWARVLKPGGRLVFTDPVLTGPITNAELAARAPFFFVLAPPGYDERLLGEAGFDLQRREVVTADLAEIARRHFAARAAHADVLRALEGEAVFASQNQYRATAELLARERRLSHVAFLARKPA